MVNMVAPNNCQLKRSKLDTCCCEVHRQVAAHYNLYYKFHEEDSIFRPVQLGELEESVWEELGNYNWESDGVWDININANVVLGMEQT